jgi:hypothetical protein
MRKTKKLIAVDLLENSGSVDQDDLAIIKKQLEKEHLEKLLKSLK